MRYCLKMASFNLSNLYLAPPLGVMPFEFDEHLWRQKTRISGLSCSVVYVMIFFAVSIEHQLTMDRQRAIVYTALA